MQLRLSTGEFVPVAPRCSTTDAMAGDVLPPGVPESFASVFAELRRVAAVCLAAVAVALGTPPEEWLSLTDLGGTHKSVGRVARWPCTCILCACVCAREGMRSVLGGGL